MLSACKPFPKSEVRLLTTASDLRAVACVHVHTMVKYWLSLILGPFGAYKDLLLGRLWWPHWEHIVEDPQYPLGVWLGRNSSDENWTCLSARYPGSEVGVRMQNVPSILSNPWKGESPRDTPIKRLRQSSHEGKRA